MRRLTLVTALAGLIAGGCAQSRPDKFAQGPVEQPVGLVPVPSIHDTINRGTNGKVAKATLPNPSNPNWSGQPLIPRRPETGLAPQMASAHAEPPRELAVAPSIAAAPRGGDLAATAGEAQPLPDPVEALPDASPAAHAVALPEPAELTPVAESEPIAPRPELAEDPLLGPAPDLMPAIEAVAEPAPLEAAPVEAAPAEAAVVEPKAPSPALEPAGDPLLGPAPDLMPAIEPTAPAPAPKAEAAAIPELPELAPAAEAAPEPAPVPAPLSGPATPTTATPRVDAEVRTAAAAIPATPVAADVDEANWKEAGRAAARVGNEVITLRELVQAVKDTVRKQGGKVNQLSPAEQNMVAKNILAALIERSLMVQEAKQQLRKNDKQLAKIQETADKIWREQELGPLLRQHGVEDELRLRRKLAEEGKSLDTLIQGFRQEFLAYAFMQQKIGARLDVSLPEMLAYYNQHINDKDNYRAPVVVWREILVEKNRHPTPEDARRKIDAVADRLRRGEDFAAVAAVESEGPARIKAAGGLMETVPGSYIVAAVNQAVDALPLGTISDVVEGPESYHLIRVDERRNGGPASFAELQDSIRKAVKSDKTELERRNMIAELRKKTIITTIFDGTDSDPNQLVR